MIEFDLLSIRIEDDSLYPPSLLCFIENLQNSSSVLSRHPLETLPASPSFHLIFDRDSAFASPSLKHLFWICSIYPIPTHLHSDQPILHHHLPSQKVSPNGSLVSGRETFVDIYKRENRSLWIGLVCYWQKHHGVIEENQIRGEEGRRSVFKIQWRCSNREVEGDVV